MIAQPLASEVAAKLLLMSRLQFNKVPKSKSAASSICSCHVPTEGIPLNNDRGSSGLNLPVNGAVPKKIGVGAESSKMVSV